MSSIVDVPDIFKPKNLIGEKVVSSSTYSETGWISITYFAADNGCIDPAMTSGTAVNRCVNRKIFRLFSGMYFDLFPNSLFETFRFRFRLISIDSCTGAVVEEYLDDSCTVLDTSRQLNYAGTCTILGDTTYQTSCTTNSGFSLAYNAVVTTYAMSIFFSAVHLRVVFFSNSNVFIHV